jgi:epoxyqueuosine reductase QueG
MNNSFEIKQIVLKLGADLCGITSVDRFQNAPIGFQPKDLYPDCKSVIVFAKKIPESIYYSNSPIPYSFVDDIVSHEILRITYNIALELEKINVIAVPIPSDPYEYWDKETMTGKGLLSFKHAGYLAGLGVIGRNGLLCNPKYGNLVKLGVLLTNIELESDKIIEYDLCSDMCDLCINSCPSGALEIESVNQKKCRLHSEGKNSKGIDITVCHICRSICPNRNGWIEQ